MAGRASARASGEQAIGGERGGGGGRTAGVWSREVGNAPLRKEIEMLDYLHQTHHFT